MGKIIPTVTEPNLKRFGALPYLFPFPFPRDEVPAVTISSRR